MSRNRRPCRLFAGGEEAARPGSRQRADQLLRQHLPALRLLGQMGGYLLAEHEGDLYLIDQVAARRRLEYDQILASLEKRRELPARLA